MNMHPAPYALLPPVEMNVAELCLVEQLPLWGLSLGIYAIRSLK